ncbi:methionyl-tRNA formyltransferase [Microvenator marinus]|uniref:Methionyl-tRNA formyltransferase n=2 Tax=Microvenator marinus TaxID=2600177 RepID=A0A5B8Y3Q0_9DELT|nr:methionyl-tRNA formyltransferase [Microvenator marinus]
MGTPEFATPALQALIDSHHQVVGVFTQPDRPSGRGKKLTPPPVKVLAESHAIPVFQPEKVRKNDEVFEQLQALEPDIAVVAAYGQILPQRILDVPKFGCVNIHASLLPKYRGASPIQAAVVAGESETGVTIMQMEAGLDTGPAIQMKSIPIDPLHTSQDVHDQLAALGATMIVGVLDDIEAGTAMRTPQDDALSSYAPMLKKEDGILNFAHSAVAVANKIRGLNPWPGAQATLVKDGTESRVKIHLARPTTEKKPGVGKVETDGKSLFIGCLDGAIEVLELQPSGSRAMKTRDFLNGTPLTSSDYFR